MNIWFGIGCGIWGAVIIKCYLGTATHCHTLPHTATHCNTLQHSATHCNVLQHTATHCNTQGRWLSSVLQCVAMCCRVLPLTLQHTATHSNTLQHTATHCNTLQHTATHCTHCNTLLYRYGYRLHIWGVSYGSFRSKCCIPKIHQIEKFKFLSTNLK